MSEFGPTGRLVYESRYSRTKPTGDKETWPESTVRVVDGNLELADRRQEWPWERSSLLGMMQPFKLLPAGRHLSMTGIGGRQFLFNCHVAPWPDALADHFEFVFMRLMEGGGVGANYSNVYLADYPEVVNSPTVHIVCDPAHPDYTEMAEAGILSSEFDSAWPGAFEVEDSREGWAEALVQLISDHYHVTQHPDRVFDVSRVRCKGSRLKTFGGTASGPLPLGLMLHEANSIVSDCHGFNLDGMSAMAIDHAIAKCVVSGGARRSARMAMMRWDDWQVDEFLSCKSATGSHWTTNISVEVDDAFWQRLSECDPGAADVFVRITDGMVNNGEPGFWNSSLSNEGEPNPVICTNPCGEIALEPFENCNLGHINLAAFVDEDGELNRTALAEAHRLMTRFLIRATFGDVTDPEQAHVLARNRRIGVGHFGFASAAAKMGIPYSHTPKDHRIRATLREMSGIVDEAARDYAHKLRIPVPVKTRTVAPTGTIAKMPGVSEGIHPILMKYFIRRIRMSTTDPHESALTEQYREAGYTVEPCIYAANTAVIEIPTKDILMSEVESRYGVDEAERIVEATDDVTPETMLAVQAMYQQEWADNAVSYTVNIEQGQYRREDIADAILSQHKVLKGATVYPTMSMPQSPYEKLTRERYESATNQEIADSVDEECASGACPIN